MRFEEDLDYRIIRDQPGPKSKNNRCDLVLVLPGNIWFNDQTPLPPDFRNFKVTVSHKDVWSTLNSRVRFKTNMKRISVTKARELRDYIIFMHGK